MRLPFLRACLLLTVVLLTIPSVSAVIMKLTPLAEILEGDDYIFVASVDKVDPEKPSAVFKVEKKLKGDPPYERIPVNMTGNAESKKANDTKIILDRLDSSRKVIFFVSERGNNHNAKVFVEGSWFSVTGVEDAKDKVVRWAFQNGEPFLRRTFKGTSAELVKVIEDGLAKKAKPPAPNEKEKEGYGPPVEKKEPKKCGTESGVRSRESGVRSQESGVGSRESGVGSRKSEILTPDSRLPTPSGAVLGVIPSLALIGPMAAIAALFPGVFARMAIGMKRWRAFLVVASINSTLALIYWAIQTWWPTTGWWFGIQAFTIYLMVITAAGLGWAGRRYRRMAVEDPTVTHPPGRAELFTLGGLTAFAAISSSLVAIFADWGTNLELPMREFTFIGIAMGAATLYGCYRYTTRAVDTPENFTPPDRRLSISGEMIGLAALFLCGFTVTVAGGGNNTVAATGNETGDADVIGPRFVSVKAFNIPKCTQVMSGIVVVGDRLYFGARRVRSSEEGQLFCMNRETGEVVWRFEANFDLKPVFCTPTVADGKVYCGEGMHEDKECRLFCVDAATGKPAWEKPVATASHTEGAPAVVGGKVIFPAGDDGVFAVDAKNGTKLWPFKGGKEAGIHIDAAPTVSGNRVFVGSGLYSFVAVCLDAENGNQLWRTDLKHRAFGAPLVVGKHVYFGVGTGNLGEDVVEYKEEGEKKDKEPAGAVVCLEAESGKEVWRYDLPRSVHCGLAGDAFSIYAGSRDGNVYALDRKTGKLRWKTGIGGPILACPAVATAGGSPVAVYAVSREGNVACLNPHTGKIAWQKSLPGYQIDEKGLYSILSRPAVVTTATPTGSKRTIYIGALTVDPGNTTTKTAAVFRLDDEIGDE